MRAASVELYAAAFVAQCEAMRGRGQAMIAEAGLRGVRGIEDAGVRLLVTDDQAHDALAALLPDARAGMIRVCGAAERCARLVADQLGWDSDTVTAMVSGNLSTVPAFTLPGDLRLRPVQRLEADDPGGVPLPDAIAAAISAAPAIKGPPEAFAHYLRSLPSTFRLFAAVDREGRVRATSGSGVFGEHATVIFVNTDPDWRGRGIGKSMTAHALHAAQRSGAKYAALDASDAGRPIYFSLGFESAGTVTRFNGPRPRSGMSSSPR